MEVSDSDEEIIDLNEAKTNSKTIEKKEKTSKSSLKKVKWSKTKFSIESISQIVKSDDDQSFDDIDNENDDDKNNNNDNNNEKEKEKINNDENNKNVNKNESKTSFIYTFIWEEGGNDVKLVGSFSDWKNNHDMKKDPKDNVFKLSLPLNNEVYYYKFIVDEEWKYSKIQPTKQDSQGNINNILDLTNFFINLEQPSDPHTESENEKITKKKSKKKKSSKLNNKKIQKKSTKYDTEFGTENVETNQFTEPHKNNVLGNLFNINNESKQNKIGNKKYYGFEQRNFFSSQKSYLSLSGYRHNILQHILSPKNLNGYYDIKIGLSQRYREKATTIIYYNSVSKIKN